MIKLTSFDAKSTYVDPQQIAAIEPYEWQGPNGKLNNCAAVALKNSNLWLFVMESPDQILRMLK